MPTPLTTPPAAESPTLTKLRNIIAMVASIDPADITPTQSLWEDLQISSEVGLPKILKRVNDEFSHEHNTVIRLLVDDVEDQVETVADFVDLIDNEVDLG